MYTIENILELIDNRPNEEYIELRDTVEIPFSEVVYCHGFDELIDILDERLCESWLPKFDCYYKIVDCGKGFYYTSMFFDVSITIDVNEFLLEYREE